MKEAKCYIYMEVDEPTDTELGGSVCLVEPGISVPFCGTAHTCMNRPDYNASVKCFLHILSS